MPVTYESYLCHHGVKGMKWGIRKKHYSVKAKKNSDNSTTVEEKQNKSRHTNLKVAVGVSAAVGTIAVASYLSHKYKDVALDRLTKDLAFTRKMQQAKDFMDHNPTKPNLNYAFDTFLGSPPLVTDKHTIGTIFSGDTKKEAFDYLKTNFKTYFRDRKNAKRMLYERMSDVHMTSKKRQLTMNKIRFDTSNKHRSNAVYLDDDNSNVLEELYRSLYGTRKVWR